MEDKKQNKILSLFLKILYYIVIVFVCIIGIFLVFYIVSSQLNQNKEDYHPKVSIYTIVSPSMTPTIKVYDVVVNVREDDPEEIQVGDIITYISKAPNSEGMTITHRVVQVATLPDGQYEYMTQGDNNTEPDSLYVMHDQVIGKKIMIIPKLGKIQFLISEKKGWLFLLLIPVAIYIFIDIYKLIKLIKLKNKVEEVTAPTKEDNKKVELEKNRKEKLIEELSNKEEIIETKPIEKKHESFLEKYEETIIEVKENKYTKKKETIKEEVEEIESLSEEDLALMDPLGIFDIENEPVEETKKVVEEKPKVKKNKTTVVNEQYEILDTDELTSKIKEYDNKIAELDKMLKDMDNLKSTKEVKQQEKKIAKAVQTSFLKENRIKVVSEEETKNKKKQQPKYIREIQPKKTETKKVEVSLKPVVEKQITETAQEKKKSKPRLNLDPKDIKTVKRKKSSELPIDELVKNTDTKKKTKKVKPKKKSIISIEKVR